MTVETLQNLIIERYVKAIRQVAKKKTKKERKKKTPFHLQRFIRMKKKAGIMLKNVSEEKIREITANTRAADLGIQNASRLKQEKEERNAYEKICSQAKLFYSYTRKISRH